MQKKCYVKSVFSGPFTDTSIGCMNVLSAAINTVDEVLVVQQRLYGIMWPVNRSRMRRYFCVGRWPAPSFLICSWYLFYVLLRCFSGRPVGFAVAEVVLFLLIEFPVTISCHDSFSRRGGPPIERGSPHHRRYRTFVADVLTVI